MNIDLILLGMILYLCGYVAYLRVLIKRMNQDMNKKYPNLTDVIEVQKAIKENDGKYTKKELWEDVIKKKKEAGK